MQAGISVGDNVAQVVIFNGQPLLCLFLNMVVWCWHDRCKHLGVKLFYKCSGKLI